MNQATARDDPFESQGAWIAGRARLIERAIAGLSIPTAGLIIDVAGGDGAFSELVHSHVGGRLITQDWSATECRASAAAGRSAVRGDVQRLPYADGVADVTIAFEIIEHFEMWASRIVVEELYRITKPGGVLLLSTPNRYSLESLKGLARYLANGTVWNARDDTHVTIFSLGALRRLLQHRFKIEKQLGYFFLPGVGHRATPLSYVITANPALIWLYHKLFLVARRRN